MRAEWKFVAEAAVVFALALALTAHDIDRTEAQAEIIGVCLLTLLALERIQPSRSRKYVVRAGLALVLVFCLTLRCGREIVGRFWVSVAHNPGESVPQWGDRAALIAAEKMRR